MEARAPTAALLRVSRGIRRPGRACRVPFAAPRQFPAAILTRMKRHSLHALRTAAQHFSQGRPGDAETICRRLLGNHPEASDVLHLLALVRKQQGDSAEAEQLMRDGLRREPRRADIRANLANLLTAAGRFNEAVVRRAYAKVLSGAGQYQRAESTLRAALGSADPDPSLLAELAAVRQECGAYEEDPSTYDVLGRRYFVSATYSIQ